MEIRQRVREISVESGWALMKLEGVPDKPGIAAQVFGAVAKAGISVELILQNSSVNKVTDISFTVRQGDAAVTRRILDSLKTSTGAKRAEALEHLAKVQVVGTGILNDPSYVGDMFKALAQAKVNIVAIGTSEVRITCLVREDDQAKAKDALHSAFQVGAAA